jgi:hypothetical protein
VGNSTSNSKLWIIGSIAAHAARCIACGAFLGAACGALYGLLFAGLTALLESEPGTIVATTLYFAACGAVAAALVGGLAAILHDETDAVPEVCSSAVEMPRYVPVVREVATASRPQPVNRLADSSAVDRRQIESATSQNPSWN